MAVSSVALAASRSFSDRLAELGAGLALDDFGTGYGSFTELRNLTLQTLKIDTGFVRNLASDSEDQRVVQLIIHVGKLYGISTTAEGVEDRVAGPAPRIRSRPGPGLPHRPTSTGETRRSAHPIG